MALLLTSAACASTPASNAEADRRELLRLHQEVIDAHLAGDIDLLLAAEDDKYVIADRGEVFQPTREERRGFLGPYLEATRFTVYRDLVPPVVEVSADGALGWVVVQVEARGEQFTSNGPPATVEFGSAWIELYQKTDGVWRRVGNVSNFKPSQ